MRILITGSAGFIGSHLVDLLQNAGHVVAGLDDLSGGFEENINPYADFFQVDLRDKKETTQVVNEFRPEIVYHLAADATEGRSQFTPVGCTERNYNATLNLLTACIGVGTKKFVYTSSIAVYGDQPTPFVESMPLLPEDIYGVAKASAEKCVSILGNIHNLDWNIIRPHNVYGPRQNLTDPYRNVISIFMNKIMKGDEIYIYGDGNQQRAFSYITDIIAPMAKCGLDKTISKQVFNLGSDTPVTINQMVDALEKVTKTKIVRNYLPLRPNEVKIAYCNHSKAKEMLGFKDIKQLEDGLKEMWAYVQEAGPQNTQYIDMEIESDLLPKTWKDRLI